MTQEEVEKNLRKKLQKDFEEEYPDPVRSRMTTGDFASWASRKLIHEIAALQARVDWLEHRAEVDAEFARRRMMDHARAAQDQDAAKIIRTAEGGKCEYCGRSLEGLRRGALYCCKSCRNMASRKRAKDPGKAA